MSLSDSRLTSCSKVPGIWMVGHQLLSKVVEKLASSSSAVYTNFTSLHSEQLSLATMFLS